MAIEDAVVLGNLFSRIKSPENIKFLLHAYQELRQTRCTYVQDREEVANMYYPMREGTLEGQDKGDEDFKESDLFEDVTTEQLEEFWELSTEIYR